MNGEWQYGDQKSVKESIADGIVDFKVSDAYRNEEWFVIFKEEDEGGRVMYK